MVVRGKITGKKLEHIYKTIQQIFPSEKYQHCYYSKEKVLELKTDEKNVFIERSKK